MHKSHWIRRLLGTAAILCPIFLSPTALLAEDCIDWPKKLTWDDFKGSVPTAVKDAAKEVKTTQEAVTKAKGELSTAETKLSNKEAEKKELLKKKQAAATKINDEIDPKISKLAEEKAKLAQTPAEARDKAIDEVNNNTKLDQKTKDSKIKGVKDAYPAAQKKFDDPKVKKAREDKIAGIDASIKKLEEQKSNKIAAINKEFDPQTEKLDKELEELLNEVERKKEALGKAEEAAAKAIDALNKLESASTSAPLVLGTIVMGQCGKINDIPIKAVFCRDQSYVLDDIKKDNDSAQLLQHEQTHFDIAEKYARLLRQDVKKLIADYNTEIDNLNKCDPNNKEAAKKARENFLKKLKEAGEKEAADLAAEQGAYDAETDHGTKKADQDAWNGKISDDLKAQK